MKPLIAMLTGLSLMLTACVEGDDEDPEIPTLPEASM